MRRREFVTLIGGAAVVIARHRLAIERAGWQLRHRLYDQREAVGQIVARAAIKAHPLAS